jgi:hypothetical protein
MIRNLPTVPPEDYISYWHPSPFGRLFDDAALAPIFDPSDLQPGAWLAVVKAVATYKCSCFCEGTVMPSPEGIAYAGHAWNGPDHPYYVAVRPCSKDCMQTVLAAFPKYDGTSEWQATMHEYIERP